MAYYVQIDHATQSPYSDGPEMPADRLSVRYDEFLWLYVNAELPTGSALHGEYYLSGSSDTRIPLDPPTVSGHQYRFSLIHYILSSASHYMFHFADDLSVPKYQDQWEVVTLGQTRLPRRRCLEGDQVHRKKQSLPMSNSIQVQQALKLMTHSEFLPTVG